MTIITAQEGSEGTNIQPLFRPGIVIFTGSSGEQVYEHLKSLLLSLDLAEPLRHSIGIIKVMQSQNLEMLAHYWFVNHIFTGEKTSLKDIDTKPSRFNDVLEQVKQEINQSMLSLRDIGYKEASRKPPLVYIIGNSANAVLSHILQEVQIKLPGAEIFYVLYSDTSETIEAPALDWRQRIRPTFCYLYEYHSHSPYTPDFCHYTIAQSLYTLLTTDIPSRSKIAHHDDASSESTQQSIPLFGTMSTCLITSPFEAAKEVCKYYIASQLVIRWKDISVNNDAAKLLQEQATDDTEIFRGLIGVSSFTLPNSKQVDAEVKATFKKSAETSQTSSRASRWEEVLSKLAHEAFEEWKKSTIETWQKNEGEFHERWKIRLNTIWVGDQGPTSAQKYLDFVDSVLTSKEDDSTNNTLSDSLPTTAPNGDSPKVVLDKHYAQLLTSPTRIVASSVMLAILLLIFLTLLPPLFVWVAFCVSILLYIVMNILYALYHQHKIVTAQSELHQHYKRIYDFKCVQFEEALRQQAIDRLQSEINAWQERYKELQSFSIDVQKLLLEEAEPLAEIFFARTEAKHNVYLGYGTLLLRYSRNTEHNQKPTPLERFAHGLPIRTGTNLSMQENWNKIVYRWMENKSLKLGEEKMQAKTQALQLTTDTIQRATARDTVGLIELNRTERQETTSSSLIVGKPNTENDTIIKPLTLEESQVILSNPELTPESQTIWKFIYEQRLQPLARSLEEELVPTHVFLCGDAHYLTGGQTYLQKLLPDSKVVIVPTALDATVLVAALYQNCRPPTSQFNVLFPLQTNER